MVSPAQLWLVCEAERIVRLRGRGLGSRCSWVDRSWVGQRKARGGVASIRAGYAVVARDTASQVIDAPAATAGVRDVADKLADRWRHGGAVDGKGGVAALSLCTGARVTSQLVAAVPHAWPSSATTIRSPLPTITKTSLVLVVVMPTRWAGFRWNAATFRRVWASFANARVAELELPELRLRSREDLGAVLSRLDLDLIDPRLQQGVLASGAPVSVGALIHEASIQISETAVSFEPFPDLSRALLGERLFLRVDRPFYFLLVEPKTGLILLMGQVTDPSA